MSRNAGPMRAAYLFIAPAIIGFTVFVVYPLIRSFYLALTKYNGLSDPRPAGLGNFRRLFTVDPAFWPARRPGTSSCSTSCCRWSSGRRWRCSATSGSPGYGWSGPSRTCPSYCPSSRPSRCEVHPQPAGRPAEHGPGPPRPADQPVAAEPDDGDAVDRAGDAVGRRRDDDHLPGRTAGGADRALRGGPGRRGRRLVGVRPDHPADDQPDHVAPGDPADHGRPADLQPAEDPHQRWTSVSVRTC